MIISYQWLCSYLPAPLPLEELSAALTSIGLEVEGIEKKETLRGSLEGLVVAQVVDVSPHPGADRLRLARVDRGEGEPLPIVCGAPNLAQGQKVVLAGVGTTIYPLDGEPVLIRKAKIRGEVSEGMLCSPSEIGWGPDHDGILVLDQEAPVGQPLATYFQLPEPDYALSIGLTPNRSDAFSHLGVARDLCAYLQIHKGKEWKLKEPQPSVVFPKEEGGWTLSLSSEQDCPRYAGLYFPRIAWGPSPPWLVQRLEAIGVRSVNRIVDITQYVLHETGQPLHAFDADRIEGKSVTVRRARKGEPFHSLDGRSLALDPEDLVIADSQGVLCLAGVMGGRDSGVNEQTRSLFLESALFHPSLVRRTSQRYGMRTDAALHFEKGLDPQRVYYALARASALLMEWAEAAPQAYVVKDLVPAEPRKLTLSMDYLHRLSGMPFSPKRVVEILRALGFELIADRSEEESREMEWGIPSHKSDVQIPADLVEEVMRMEGLDQVPIPEIMQFPIGAGSNPVNDRTEEIAALLAHRGFHELMTNSIAPAQWYPDSPEPVRLLNSISRELNVLRPSLMESGLEAIAHNLNRQQANLCFFEAAKVYRHSSQGGYEEHRRLGIWVTGQYWPKGWAHPAVPADGFLIKAALEAIWTLFPGLSIREKVPEDKKGEIQYRWKKECLALVQAVPRDRKALFDLDVPIWYGELNLDLLDQVSRPPLRYRDLPRYPMMQRDLSLILDQRRAYEEVEAFIRKQKPDHLVHYSLTDLFRGEKLGQGRQSMTVRFQFQHEERTLKDQEVDAIMRSLIQGFRKELQAEIRES